MVRFFSWPFSEIPKLTITAAIDILIVAVLIYQFLMIIRGRRAVNVLFGICILGLIYLAAIWVKLEVLRTILATLAPYTAIALIVMFQSELRRTLARLGHKPLPRSQPIGTPRESSGRNYQIVVPFNTQLTLVLHSSFYHVNDANGVALSQAMSTKIPLLIATGQQVPPIKFTISGAAH
jgi:hypothetical protein